MLNFGFFSALYILACIRGSLGSDIVTFSDDKCQKSFNTLDTVNGYPDGLCEPLEITGSLNAFQIAELDPGCVGAFAASLLTMAWLIPSSHIVRSQRRNGLALLVAAESRR